MAKQEILTYGEIDVPIQRGQFDEIFIALRPPDAAPYIAAPREAEPQAIVEFFAQRVEAVESLRAEMRKRFEGGKSLRCLYRTGDVAYIMGRPFMLRVNPLGARKVSRTMRGRATAKFALDTDISLITLYVVHPKNYDEAKLAFSSYAERIVLQNAKMLVRQCSERIGRADDQPPVRMRTMRGRFASYDAGCLWLSDEIIPYPTDCLAYVVWRQVMDRAELSREAQEEILDGVLDWRNAARILAERPQPYSNQ